MGSSASSEGCPALRWVRAVLGIPNWAPNARLHCSPKGPASSRGEGRSLIHPPGLVTHQPDQETQRFLGSPTSCPGQVRLSSGWPSLFYPGSWKFSITFPPPPRVVSPVPALQVNPPSCYSSDHKPTPHCSATIYGASLSPAAGNFQATGVYYLCFPACLSFGGASVNLFLKGS